MNKTVLQVGPTDRVTIRTFDRTAILAFEISKRYGRRLALDRATFEIPAGAVTGLVGPPASGKTTLLHVLAGLTPADSGVLHLKDRVVGTAGRTSTWRNRRQRHLRPEVTMSASFSEAIESAKPRPGTQSNRPELILVDPPLADCPPAPIAQLGARLRHRAEDDTTVIVASRSLEAIAAFSDWLIVVDAGIVEYCGTFAGRPSSRESWTR